MTVSDNFIQQHIFDRYNPLGKQVKYYRVIGDDLYTFVVTLQESSF